MNVTIASVVKDVEHFLPKALECWTELADRVRIIDNGSSDETVPILKDAADRHPDFRWASCLVPMDGNEWLVRSELWDYASEGAEWIVHLDADHVVADDFRPHLEGTIVSFKVYDLWDADHYRSDAWWQPRHWWHAVNVADVRNPHYKWNERGWHSGHLPSNITRYVGSDVKPMPDECSILHYGYATPQLREQHYQAYMNRYEHLRVKERFHAKTIKDPLPNTVKLPFQPRWSLL